jgi:hypothetical protein
MGWMGPVATTDLAMSPRVTLARRAAGILGSLLMRAKTTMPPTTTKNAAEPAMVQNNQRRLRLG